MKTTAGVPAAPRLNFAPDITILRLPQLQKFCPTLKIAVLPLVATWHFACSIQPRYE